MKRELTGLILVWLVLLGLCAIVIDQPTIETNSELSYEIVSKLGRSLISNINNDQLDDRVIDILVACDKKSEPDYANEANNHSPDMIITDVWPALGGFRANIPSNAILRLAELPFVTRIDMNSRGSACLDAARLYTHVDVWTQQDPSIDGDKDGSKTSYSRDDIVIAILDTGIDIEHQDLDGNKVIKWVDICGDWEGKKHSTAYDDNGHGTRCASIAAGSGDANPAFRGVARHAALVGVKMMDFTGHYDISDAIEALEWVAENSYAYGIEIVSCSWGVSNPEHFGEYDIQAMFVDWLVENYGLVVCVAAGNSGQDEGTITPPGTAKYAITVGAAIDPRAGEWSLASWSSRGPCDDGRIKPDILASGYEIIAAEAGTTNQYNHDSGTSYATPFVAGLAALWLDKDYSLRVPVSDPHPRVKKLLMASATDMPGDSHPGFDNDYGTGRVDAWDEVSFYSSDISTSSSDAPLVLSYSWSLNPYSHPNEPLWVRDRNYFPGQDWYKFNCYSGLFITATAYSDPDLVLRIKLFDANMNLLTLSFVGSYVYIGYFAQYSGEYYIQVTVEEFSGDYYDITITTTPS